MASRQIFKGFEFYTWNCEEIADSTASSCQPVLILGWNWMVFAMSMVVAVCIFVSCETPSKQWQEGLFREATVLAKFQIPKIFDDIQIKVTMEL